MSMAAYDFFLELSKIPRGSGDEKAASDHLAAFGRERGLEVIQDAARNVLIRKNGTKGRENEPPVILQAHIDMVCEKNRGTVHDFSKDPVIPVINGDWVTAEKDTTLGADDGSGVSYIMAILDSSGVSHPPIEAVFTTDEEAGMIGATRFDGALLLGRRFINIDTETEGVLTVSCAAAADVDLLYAIEREPAPENLVAHKLMISGLSGGHSGMDIHKGLANANALMGRLLKEFETVGLRVSAINGGSKRNAIPRECAAVVMLNGKDENIAGTIVRRMEAEFKSAHKADAGLKITLEKTETPKSVICAECLKNALDGVSQTPNGVLSMSPGIRGLVQTSNNLGVIATDENSVTLSNFPRSSVAAEQIETIGKLKALAASAGAAVRVANEKPAWPYSPDSPLRDTMAAVFEGMFGAAPKIEAVHAGLECGIFAEKLPDADFISFGPDIEGAHSPGERMSLPSYNRMYDYLLKVLETI